jgi:hypothetical protein
MSGMRARLQRIARGAEDPRVDVLELVNWVYSEQRANRVSGQGLHAAEAVVAGLRRGSVSQASTIAALIEVNRLGCRVDHVGYDAGDLHPVAEALHLMVAQIQSSGEAPAWLLVRYGEHAALPDGHDLEINLGPTWKGEPRYEVRACSACGADHAMPMAGKFKVVNDGTKWAIPVFCPLEWDHGPEYQAAERREYDHWWQALQALAMRCARADLDGLIVTGPAISREPWLCRDAAVAQIRRPESSDSPDSHFDSHGPQGSPGRSFVLSVLAAADGAQLVRHEDGLWRAGTGVAFNDGLVERVVNQGLAAYGSANAQGRRSLVVTADGRAALHAARLVA